MEQMSRNNTNGTINNIQQLKGMLSNIQNSANPQKMLNELICRNPKMKDVMNIVQKYGNNPKDAFYALAKEKGVNPDEVLNALRS